MTSSVCLLVLCLFIVSVGGESDDSQQTKVREARGFKNSALATARGFGKRTVLQELIDSAANPSDNVVVTNEWLVEQMVRKPDLARLVVSKFVDVDGDGLLSIRELFPEL